VSHARAGGCQSWTVSLSPRRAFADGRVTSDNGRVLVLTYQRPGARATIVHDGRSTSIPWSPHITVAAW
jgi:hypothetical protein